MTSHELAEEIVRICAITNPKEQRILMVEHCLNDHVPDVELTSVINVKKIVTNDYPEYPFAD